MIRSRASVMFFFLALLLAFGATANTARPVAAAQVVYSGNPKTMKYHNAKCRYFSCKACTVRLSSPEEARAKGYVACKHCGG